MHDSNDILKEVHWQQQLHYIAWSAVVVAAAAVMQNPALHLLKVQRRQHFVDLKVISVDVERICPRLKLNVVSAIEIADMFVVNVWMSLETVSVKCQVHG